MRIVFAAAIGLLCLIDTCLGSQEEKALIDHLFEDYDPSVRPAKHVGDKVTVQISYAPIKLNEFDVDEGTMDLAGWLQFTWNDPKLTWNASDYGGLEVIMVSPDRVWRPDVRIYNSNDMRLEETLVLIYTNGTIMHVPPVSSNSLTCGTANGALWFPFDKHECKIILGSWVYSTHKVDLQIRANDDSGVEFNGNSEWSMEGLTQERHEKIYPCCPNEPYTSVTATLSLKRRGCKYILNAFLPMIGHVILALATTMISPRKAELRLLIVSILGVSSYLTIQLSEMWFPQSFSIMNLVSSQIQLVFAALFLCNILHLTLLSAEHSSFRECRFLSKFLASKSDGYEQQHDDVSKVNPTKVDEQQLVAGAKEREQLTRLQTIIDKCSGRVLTLYVFTISALFIFMAPHMA